MRVGNGNFGQGMPKRMTGPSTIQTSSTTRLSVLIGGYVAVAWSCMARFTAGDHSDDAVPPRLSGAGWCLILIYLRPATRGPAAVSSSARGSVLDLFVVLM